MPALELKVPPPAVALVVAIAMGCIAYVVPASSAPAYRIALAIVLAVAGLALAMAGIRKFRKAQTTITPLKPQKASHLVVGGIYRFTRNPMYLGVCTVLVGWAAFLWSVWALLGPVVFVLYITRFQIVPEERALATLFGSEYVAYKERVRRWL